MQQTPVAGANRLRLLEGTGGEVGARVHVLALGGTIAMTSDSAAAGVRPTLDAAALVDAVPQLAQVADVVADTFRTVPGAHLRIGDVVELARAIAALPPDDGVVVTQGTDTLEHTAYLLELLLPGDRPVVVTGAMRAPQQPGTDGPANLLSSVRVAASDAARGAGVVVVLDDVIHPARFVRKGHTARPSAFTSPTAGPIGWIAEDRVRIPLRPARPVSIDLAAVGAVPHVALVPVPLGDDGPLVRAVAGAGYEGLVIQAFGAGHVPSWVVDDLEALAQRMPVVLSSSVGSGELFAATYGFPGSERDVLGRGLISAGALDGPRARLLLSLLLAAGSDRDAVAATFTAAST
jgi:L-asparaginase